MTDKILHVLINEKDVGRILQRSTESYSFEYLPEWQANARHVPLSRSLPVQQQRHSTKPITNFMWGLLPDNARTLEEWSRRFQVSARNPFALLAAVGQDCPGAVQIVGPNTDFSRGESIRRLTRKDLEERIRALNTNSGAGRLGSDTGQFSLAGAQAKTALYKIKNSWAVPEGRTPTTHIFKPESGQIPNIASNEHFCLKLARCLDLPAAISTVETIDGIPVIIVERYDRLRRPQGVVRVHQEDMCQALGVNPMRKYQAEGGPGIREIMQLLRESANPDLDRDRFMRAQALNFVIAGTDAHARNYSIVYAPGGAFRLAPLYDIISDLPYAADRRESSLAMKIGGHRVLREILPRHWEILSADVEFDASRGLAHVRDLIARAPDEADAVLADLKLNGLHNPILVRLCKELRARCKDLALIYGSEVLR